MKKYLIGASIAALLAVPALAFQHDDHDGPKGPQTRAQVEAKVKEHFAKIDANHDGVTSVVLLAVIVVVTAAGGVLQSRPFFM